MRISLLLLFSGMVILGTAGCASDDPPNAQPRVSNLPWSRPEKWESQGPMGGMMPGSQ